MPIHLIRHADALPGRPDATRPLSKKGRSDASRMAKFLAGSGAFTPTQLWHSPLLRARQTAQLIAEAMTPGPVLLETDHLLPEDDPVEIATRLGKLDATASVAIVGHEPYLGALASLLVRGKPGRVLFDVRKCSVLAFNPAGSANKKTGLPRWHALWHLIPEFAPTATTGRDG